MIPTSSAGPAVVDHADHQGHQSGEDREL